MSSIPSSFRALSLYKQKPMALIPFNRRISYGAPFIINTINHICLVNLNSNFPGWGEKKFNFSFTKVEALKAMDDILKFFDVKGDHEKSFFTHVLSGFTHIKFYKNETYYQCEISGRSYFEVKSSYAIPTQPICNQPIEMTTVSVTDGEQKKFQPGENTTLPLLNLFNNAPQLTYFEGSSGNLIQSLKRVPE